jgi:hypothetical protein
MDMRKGPARQPAPTQDPDATTRTRSVVVSVPPGPDWALYRRVCAS